MPRHTNDEGLSNADERTYLWFLSAPCSGTDLMLKMIDTSPRVSSLNDDFLKADMPIEHIEKMCRANWDTSKPILCDMACEQLIRFEQWHTYWSEKYPDAKVKYLAMIKDPWQFPTDIASWVSYNYELMETIESKEYDIHLVKYEDFVADPRMTAFKLIKWCPDLYCLDYSIKPDDTNDTELAYLKKDEIVRFDEIANYFGYKTYDCIRHG